MTRLSRGGLLFVILLLGVVVGCGEAGDAQRDGDPAWVPAIDLVLQAFETHPLVAISEGAGHGQLDTLEFFTALVEDRRFAATVNSIVVEFGNARFQDVVDRYVSGADVPRRDLRRVWEDTTQVTGVWSVPMYEQMLARVRSVNAALPAARRIRVLLGDPPIDWSAVTSPADDDLNDARDAHAADVVAREVMHRRQRALILYGGAHLSRRVVLPNSLIHLLDARFPGRTWVAGVLDYTRVDAGIRQRLPMNGMPTGSSVRNTWLGKLDGQRIGFGLSRGLVEEDVDALLVFSTAPPRLQQAPPLEEEYSLELARRRALGTATLPFRGGKIRFVEGRETLAADADAPLHAVLEELRRDRGLRLLIKGHADRSEPDADALSARRAHIVVAWLAARGVSADRLTATGCGARRPITFGSTDEERAANRWAELVRLTVRAGCDPAW